MSEAFFSPHNAITFLFDGGKGPMPFRVGFPNGNRADAMREYKRICEANFGPSAIVEAVDQQTAFTSWTYDPEGRWACPMNVFYFRDESDAVAFRLSVL